MIKPRLIHAILFVVGYALALVSALASPPWWLAMLAGIAIGVCLMRLIQIDARRERTKLVEYYEAEYRHMHARWQRSLRDAVKPMDFK